MNKLPEDGTSRPLNSEVSEQASPLEKKPKSVSNSIGGRIVITEKNISGKSSAEFNPSTFLPKLQTTKKNMGSKRRFSFLSMFEGAKMFVATFFGRFTSKSKEKVFPDAKSAEFRQSQVLTQFSEESEFKVPSQTITDREIEDIKDLMENSKDFLPVLKDIISKNPIEGANILFDSSIRPTDKGVDKMMEDIHRELEPVEVEATFTKQLLLRQAKKDNKESLLRGNEFGVKSLRAYNKKNLGPLFGKSKAFAKAMKGIPGKTIDSTKPKKRKGIENSMQAFMVASQEIMEGDSRAVRAFKTITSGLDKEFKNLDIQTETATRTATGLLLLRFTFPAILFPKEYIGGRAHVSGSEKEKNATTVNVLLQKLVAGGNYKEGHKYKPYNEKLDSLGDDLKKLQNTLGINRRE